MRRSMRPNPLNTYLKRVLRSFAGIGTKVASILPDALRQLPLKYKNSRSIFGRMGLLFVLKQSELAGNKTK
jgi:hypothetical protein